MRVNKNRAIVAVGILSLSLLPIGAQAATAAPVVNDPAGASAEPYVNEIGVTVDPRDPFVDSSESALVAQPPAVPEGTMTPMNIVIEANPYGCRGQTFDAHKSNGMMSLHARTFGCSSNVIQMTTSPQIMKLGFFGIWHSLGSNPKTKANTRFLETDSKRVCSSYDSQTYRGNGYHRVEIGSKSYVAQTSSPNERREVCNAHAL